MHYATRMNRTQAALSKSDSDEFQKPLLRGHFHQASFFIALGAGAMLISKSQGLRAHIAALIYTMTLITLFGVSALYHRPQWNTKRRALMRRLDHSAIFLLIAGTVTPICLLALPEGSGENLLLVIWIATFVGILQSVFWVRAPKWLTAVLYVLVGWMSIPYFSEIKSALGAKGAFLILAGGIVYTVGALVYAFKKPNPSPRYFGYHEIFHLLVMIAALLHFLAISQLLNPAA